MKILTAERMRQIDQACISAGTPADVLMENAGRAVADETRRLLDDMKNQHILCLVGAGNNGGDALVAARYFQEMGAAASIYLCSPRPADDTNLKLTQLDSIPCFDAAEDRGLEKFDELLAAATCVIDGLLGTGRMRPLEGFFKQVLEKVSARRGEDMRIVAVDLPSGMDANSGACDPACPSADLTVTLAFPKQGLFRLPGAARVGKLKIADIGIPAALADDIKLELITAGWAGETLPPRPPGANKGSFGRALVAAGSINYIGAAYLAASGALRAGTGLVTLAAATGLQPALAARIAEATWLPLAEVEPGIIAKEAAETVAGQAGNYQALLVGCGLGQHESTRAFLTDLLKNKQLPKLVIDADALNILAGTAEWWQKLPVDAIVTPHPGEMSRLCGLSIDEIQADRVGAAMKYAAAWNKTVVLKGAFTVIAAPDGRCRVSPFANAGLATAGTGDVLAGVITGLLAQGLPPFDAAALGVYLHGTAGQLLKDTLGDAGILASDLLPALPEAIKRLKAGEKPC